MRFKRIAAGVLCAALGITLGGCGKIPELSEDGTPPKEASVKTVKLSDSGELDITRKDIGNTPMGEDGSWTVFVYMSGSNLESAAGKATEDLNEMLAAATGKNVRFIIQTGGAAAWKNDFVTADKLCRFEISGGKRKELARLPSASMAEGATLRSFLKWGVENYPAAKMGVVFWGHGKGALGGVCKDNRFDEDYLQLSDLNNALAEVSENMTDKFEFLGFDNCYMGTLETADIAASYARYMIGSEELEPAGGWDYTALGNLLGEQPEADWDVISKTLCDGFFDSNFDSEIAAGATFSVTELSKLDDIVRELNGYSAELCEKLKDRKTLAEFQSALENAEHFGDDGGYDGFGNTADLADFARAGKSLSERADELLNAIEAATVYKRLGEEHPNACGLSVYYPFKPNGAEEMRKFADISVCPYYFAQVELTLRAASPAAQPLELLDFDKNETARLWCGDSNENSHELYGLFGEELGKNKDGSRISSLIEFSKQPELKNEQYSLTVKPESLKYIKSVGMNVCSAQADHKFYELGTKSCANADWSGGEFSDTFNGKWFLLPNKEPLPTKPKSFGGYVARVSENGIECALSFTSAQNEVSLLGEWRNRTVSACYDVCTYDNDRFSTETGTEYTFGESPQLVYGDLSDGDYFYLIAVTDIWGGEYHSEIVNFSIKNGSLIFQN